MDDHVKEAFVCKYEGCNKFFEDPVIIDCGVTVCRVHVDDLLSKENIINDSFKCKICKEQHLVPREGFIFNRNMRIALSGDSHLTEEQREVRKTVKEFEDTLSKINNIINEPADYLDDYVKELRRKNDLQREELKEKIDNIALDMIDKIDQFEDECKKKLKSSGIQKEDLSQYTSLVEACKNSIRTKDADEEELKKLIKSVQKMCNKSMEKLKEIETKILNNRSIEFEPKTIDQFHQSDFGAFQFLENVKPEVVQTIECDLVTSMKYLDPDRLITGHENGEINIWDMRNGHLLGTLQGHAEEVNCLVSLPNNRLASGACDCTIRVWNLENNECVNTFEDHDFGFYQISLVFSPDGKLLSGDIGGSIKTWDLDAARCISKCHQHSSGVSCLKISPKGEIISASEDCSIIVWFQGSDLVTRLIGHTKTVNCIEFLPNGNLVSGSSDKTIRIWDMDRKICLKSFSFLNCINNIFVKDQDRIYIQLDDKFILMNINAATDCFKFIGITCFAILPNGNLALATHHNVLISRNALLSETDR
jgi:WD40 repeat protein